MRRVIWTDNRGYKRCSLIKDNDPDSKAQYGVPVGPPDLDEIDWEEVKRQISNTLADYGMFTWNEVQGSPIGLTAALNVLKRYLVDLYRHQNNK